MVPPASHAGDRPFLDLPRPPPPAAARARLYLLLTPSGAVPRRCRRKPTCAEDQGKTLFRGNDNERTKDDAKCVDFGGRCEDGHLITPTTSRRQENHCGSCKDGFFLDDRSCKACDNRICPTNKYRTGTCTSAANDNYQCMPCANTTCPANNTYQAGQCSGTTNGFTCEECSNVVCPSSLCRSGHCGGTRTSPTTTTHHHTWKRSGG